MRYSNAACDVSMKQLLMPEVGLAMSNDYEVPEATISYEYLNT